MKRHIFHSVDRRKRLCPIGLSWPGMAAALVALLPFAVGAISTPDAAVRLSAVVATNPPSVTLQWVYDPDTTTNLVYRKEIGAASWGTAIAGLAANATGFVDTTVSAGTNYEYRVSKSAKEGSTVYSGNGYIVAMLDPPLVESRGKCVLLVDQTFTNDLKNELARLELDLVGDGWTVLRRDIARTASVVSVKSIIQSDWAADSNGVNTVFIFGRVPVPYSGNLAPDGHPDHVGAWPADVYYADMDGAWTDTTVSNSTSGRVKNIPGDGKFDQTANPSEVELQVGRVDLSAMPAFPSAERDLLRFYLAKAHNYRMNYFVPSSASIIDDNFGFFDGEAFAASAWRSWTPLVGVANVFNADWPTYLSTAKCVWAYGCGGGSYSSASGVDTTTGMAGGRRQAVFTMVFGSYHGDWDTSDNFLRAPLASQPSALTCAWSGRPHWFLHTMGAGFPIGHSVKVTQNNNYDNNLYDPTRYGNWVHVGLMGDPTLRMSPLAPPSELSLVVAGPDVTLSWRPSPDAGVTGYHIFRAATGSTSFVRMTATPVSATSWTDAPPRTADVWYMVRGVKRVTSPSGIFTDMSQGIFNRLTVAGDVNHPPVAENFAIATNEDFTISFVLTGSDPDGTEPFCAIQKFPDHGRLSGSPTNMVYRPDTNWFGTDTFVYHASDALSDSAAATVTVTIAAMNDPPVPSNATVRVTNDTPRSIAIIATDVENDPLTYVLTEMPTNGELQNASSPYVYTVTNAAALGDRFRFRVSDGQSASTGTVTIVIVTRIEARQDFATTLEDTSVVIQVLTNDTDSGGHPLYLASVALPVGGRSVGNTVRSGSSVTFEPYQNWNGNAVFSYTVTNGYAGLATGVVTVEVVAVNDVPHAYDSDFRVLSGKEKALPPLALAYDVEDRSDLTYHIVEGPLHGLITGNATTLIYQSNADYAGQDAFRFWVSDGQDTSPDTGTVSIMVVPITFRATNVNHITNGIDYVYSEGVFTSIAQAAAAPPVKEGVSFNGLDLSPRNRNTNMAFRWEGYFNAPADAEYSFYTFSRLQLQLEIWGVRVFSGTQTISGTYQSEYSTNSFAMEAGLHPVAITYYMTTNSSPYTSISFEDAEGYIFDDFSSLNLFRRTAATLGTPLAWLRASFGWTNDYDVLERADTDGDGQENWMEFRAGTDPTNHASQFAILDLNSTGNLNELSWYATTNSGATNLMAIAWATNLTDGAWTVMASNLTRSADGTNTWTVPLPASEDSRFYRPLILP